MPSETAKASLGYVTSYGAAKRGGYQGTYEEWCALMAEVADHLEQNIQLNEDSQAAKAAAETAELEAETAALTAESWAKGTRGGTAVPDTDPAYHDNAKYYADEAEYQKGLAVQASQVAAQMAGQAEGHSTDAEAWAKGTRGGEDVESGDDAYQNNAKYFSEQSAGSATEAAGSASTAEGWATGGSGGTAGAQNNAKYYSEQAASSAQTAAAMGTNFAPEFSSSTPYSAGDYVLYQGTLYRFTADHAAGAWVGTDATVEKIAPVVSDLKESLNEIENDLYETFSTRVTAGVVTGAILSTGEATTSNSQYIVKYDCSDIKGKTITIRTTKNRTDVSILAICAFYDIPSIDLTRSSATIDHVVGVGKPYAVEYEGNITESIIVPNDAESMYVSYGKDTPGEEGNDPYRPILSYFINNDIKTRLSDVETDVNNIQTDVNDIQTDVNNAELTIDEIKEAMPLDIISLEVSDPPSRGSWQYNEGGKAVENPSDSGTYYYRDAIEIPENVVMSVKNSRYYNSNKSRPVMVVDEEYNILLALTNDGTLTNSDYEFRTPIGAKYLLLTQYQSGTDPTVEYNNGYNKIASEDYIEEYIENYTDKKPYESGKIFFTVDCPRPIPFGDSTELVQTTAQIQCVLRLPSNYTPNGKPTRLVLACHGSSGYIDIDEDIWYNSNWTGLMNYIVNAGYAVFDANVLGGSNPTGDPEEESSNIVGFAVGSPLYAQALKYAYDYIVDNYNVYEKIFAHGTSMGGVGAKTFAHLYPQLVLAVSSFAGRDICKYLKQISSGSVPYSGRFSVSYGYANDQALLDDKFSHVTGISDSLGILKILHNDNLAIDTVSYPPDRDTNFSDWLDYYAEINSQTRADDLSKWIGHNSVPYKSWNAWGDEETSTAQEILMQNAYSKTNGKPYYAVTYDLEPEEYQQSTQHTVISYGQVRGMRAQLIQWYKRWE